MKWKKEKKKLSDLKPSKYNPRTISDLAKQKLRDDIDTFGNQTPITINKDRAIISGHTRYEILKEKYGEDYEIEVIVPNKQLDPNIEKHVGLILTTHRGTWDLKEV